VNEGGTGDLNLVVRNTLATHNGADGIELDVQGDGDVVFTLSGVQITGNGSFHEVFPPADPEDIDLDDGMDVDESSDGDLIGTVSNSLANDNFEEGWDFNENDAGDFLVSLTNVRASRNLEEGVDFEEDDDFASGGLVTTGRLRRAGRSAGTRRRDAGSDLDGPGRISAWRVRHRGGRDGQPRRRSSRDG
jgi:hypothetical protein